MSSKAFDCCLYQLIIFKVYNSEIVNLDFFLDKQSIEFIHNKLLKNFYLVRF